MKTIEVIEDIFSRQLQSLCTCAHRTNCMFCRASVKAVIQCELFQLKEDDALSNYLPRGLCENCDHAATCALPGRRTGVWHCNEFQ
jgi:hypothetical protein